MQNVFVDSNNDYTSSFQHRFFRQALKVGGVFSKEYVAMPK